MAAAAAPRGIFHPPKLHTGTSTPADPPAFLVDELAGLVDLDGRPLKANQWYYAETRGNWRCFGLRSAQFPDGRPEPIGLYCGILTGNVWTADGALMKDLQAVIRSECQQSGRVYVALTADMMPTIIRRFAYGQTQKRGTEKLAPVIPWRLTGPPNVAPPTNFTELATNAVGGIDAEELERSLEAAKQAETAAVAARTKESVDSLDQKVAALAQRLVEQRDEFALQLQRTREECRQEVRMAQESARAHKAELDAARAEITALTAHRDSLARELDCALVRTDVAVELRRAAEAELADRRERESPAVAVPDVNGELRRLAAAIAQIKERLDSPSREVSLAPPPRATEGTEAYRLAFAKAEAASAIAKNAVWAGVKACAGVVEFAEVRYQCTAKYTEFAADPKLTGLVDAACHAWLPTYKDKATVLHLAPTKRNVLAAHAASVLFSLKWDPAGAFRQWLLEPDAIARFKDKDKTKAEGWCRAVIQRLIGLDDVTKVDAWLPRRCMLLMKEHYSFAIDVALAGNGPPVAPQIEPRDATSDERLRTVHANLYHCWYDLLEATDAQRDQLLLCGAPKRRKDPMPWVPPAYVDLPEATGGSRRVTLNWLWDQADIS